MEAFGKIVNGFSFSTIFAKSFILDTWQGFELTFVLIIFAKLLPFCFTEFD